MSRAPYPRARPDANVEVWKTGENSMLPELDGMPVTGQGS